MPHTWTPFKNFLERRVEAEEDGGGGDGGASMAATAFSVDTTPNTVTGEGDITVLTFPADTPVLALKLDGDDFPRWLLTSNGTVWLADGTVDPYDGTPWSRIGPSAPGVFTVQGSNGVILDGDTAGTTVESGDLHFNDNSQGVVLRSPNGGAHRLKVANDGTLSTEVAT